MLKLSNFEREIIVMGHEDYYGLWEALWRANTYYPNKPEQERHAIAKAALEKLVDNGLVYLCHFDLVHNRGVPIEPTEARVALSKPENWEPPPSFDTIHVRFANTDEGDRYFYEG